MPANNKDQAYSMLSEQAVAYQHELATKLHEAQLIIDYRMLSRDQVRSVLNKQKYPTLVKAFAMLLEAENEIN